MLAAAGHKSYAPFGSAFLYGPRALMDAAPPYKPGGGTVHIVSADRAWFNRSPERHMGGTPNVTGVVAFAAATEWLADIGMDKVRQHELDLLRTGMRRFAELEEEYGIRLLGPRDVRDKAGVFSFLVPGVDHATVSATLSRQYGIATRNGCFCAQPLIAKLLELGDVSAWGEAMTRGENVALPGATRATIGIYQEESDILELAHGVGEIAKQRPPLAPTRPVVEVS
jgi:selenocysteine lyase/cysteine desulfurase